MIRIGYACINTRLASAGKTCRLKNASNETILKLSRQNLIALKHILLWNREHGIELFRISSETIPFGSHPANQLRWRQLLKTELSELGRLINTCNLRVSMHPGQYTVLNSIHETVVAASIAELDYHARLLDALSVDTGHKIVLHIGGSYGDKKEAMRRFARNFEKLPRSVQKRLAIENDEKTYTAADVLTMARKLHIPMILDVFHHRCNPSLPKQDLPQLLESVASTWRPHDGRKKIHYSNQQKGKPAGSHSETIDTADFHKFYGRIRHLPLDIMLEVKNKEQSVLELYRRIPSLKTEAVCRSRP